MLWAAVSLALWWAPARAEVVDRVVVVVENELVLQSEVDLEAALADLDASPSPFWRSGSGIQRLVQAAAIRAAAGDVALYAPPPAEVNDRREALRLHFDDRDRWNAFLARWGHSEASLTAVLRRRMVVERFLARNVLVPTDPPGPWITACETLLDDLTGRYRIRYTEERAPGAP